MAPAPGATLASTEATNDDVLHSLVVVLVENAMKRSLGWLVILIPFAVVFILLGLYVLTGRVDQSVLPHGEAQRSESQTP